MDTRTKIVPPQAVQPGTRAVRLVIGYFNPLTAEHVRRLQQIRSGDQEPCVVAAIDDDPDALLPLRSRQELVAALKAVDFVISADQIPYLYPQPIEVIDERPIDVARTRALIEHVVQRYPLQ